MKEHMHARAYLLHGKENAHLRKIVLAFAVSIICHLIFFLILIFAPSHKPDKKFSPSVIDVRMVTFSEQEAASLSSRQTALKSEAPVTKQIQVQDHGVSPQAGFKVDQKPSKEVSVTSKKIKRSLKKKTFKSSRIVKSAIARIEKKVEESRPDPLTKAIDRLRDKVGKMGATDRLKHKAGKDADGHGAGLAGRTGAATKRTLELIDIYRVEIAYQIQKNWAFSEQLAGGRKDLMASLVFKVMPNGEIRDIFFTDRSGNRHLDESAYKAIQKSNPVTPHPEGVIKPFVEVGLRFTPEGVR